MKRSFSETTWITVIVPAFSALLLGMVIFQVMPLNLFYKYPVAAQNYLEGILPQERLVDFSPLYLFLHILIGKFFIHPNTVLLWIQILITSVASGFIYTILRKHYSATLALMGALVFITHPSVIIYTSTFEPEPLMFCFILGYILFAMETQRFSPLYAGIWLSLTLLTRSNFFPLVFITPMIYWLREKAFRSSLRPSLLFLLPAVISLTFLMARNTWITGTFTPFAMNPGNVFYEGNNPNSTGESAIYPPLIYDSRIDFPEGSDYRHEIYRIVAKRIEQKAMTVSEINRYWVNKAKNFIADHPGRFISTLSKKITFLFHGFRRHDIWYLYVKDRYVSAVIPSLPFAVISAMAVMGMLLSARFWKEKLILYAVFFTQLGIMLLTYVSERQRVAIVPIMIIFAAGAFQDIVKRKKRVGTLAGVIVLTLLFNMPNDLIRDEMHVNKATHRCDTLIRNAIDHRMAGRYSTAGRANVLAFASAPWRVEDIRLSGLTFAPKSFREQALETAELSNDGSPSARFDLAVLYIANNMLNKADSILTELTHRGYQFNRRYTQSSLPEYYRACIYELREDDTKSVLFLKKALDKNPGDPWVLSRLAVHTGDRDYHHRLVRYFSRMDAAFFLGKAYLETGRYDDAVKQFSYLVSRLPEYRKGLIYYSLALAASGKYEQAAKTYITAIDNRSDFIFREKDVIRVFTSWLDENPHNKAAESYLSRVARDFGNAVSDETK